MQVIIYFFWDHLAHLGYFENQIPLKPALGDVCSLANYSVAYEKTQSTESPIFMILRVLCFQRQSFLTFTYVFHLWHLY